MKKHALVLGGKVLLEAVSYSGSSGKGHIQNVALLTACGPISGAVHNLTSPFDLSDAVALAHIARP